MSLLKDNGLSFNKQLMGQSRTLPRVGKLVGLHVRKEIPLCCGGRTVFSYPGFLSLGHRIVDMDWDWLLRNAKLRDRQNRLGFAVSLANELAELKNDSGRVRKLRRCLEILERA